MDAEPPQKARWNAGTQPEDPLVGDGVAVRPYGGQSEMITNKYFSPLLIYLRFQKKSGEGLFPHRSSASGGGDNTFVGGYHSQNLHQH